MSSRVWKFLSDTIGKLQSPRPFQQNGNATESSSLHQTDSLSDTPTRHGSSNKPEEQVIDTAFSSTQDESVLDTPLNKKSNNIREKLQEAVKPIKKSSQQDDAQENVTSSYTTDEELGKAPKITKRSPSDGPFAIPPPRRGRNKGKEVAEVAEPLAHKETPVEAPSNNPPKRGRGRPAKIAKAVANDEASSCAPRKRINAPKWESNEELAESFANNEQPVNNSLSGSKSRTRGRPTKKVVYDEAPSYNSDGESSVLEREHITELAEASVQDEYPVDILQTKRGLNTRRILPKVEESIHTLEPLIETTLSGNKRRRDMLEPSAGNEGPEIDSTSSASNKRRKLAQKPEGMGIPPVGTTQAARDERRKYMDRERQRRCRQRKKERQQEGQAVDREDVEQVQDERKKAMARERVRRHRDSQRQKLGPETETKKWGRQRTGEEARQRDRELIAAGGQNFAATPAEDEAFKPE